MPVRREMKKIGFRNETPMTKLKIDTEKKALTTCCVHLYGWNNRRTNDTKI